MKTIKYSIFILLVIFSFFPLLAQQKVDSTFKIELEIPRYAKGEGPLVSVDAGHNNLHTSEGGYYPFSRLLMADGYDVESVNYGFNQTTLEKIEILVIVNPLHKSNIGNWTNPCPSAFTESEIDAVEQWVSEGGRLLLIADHMPFAGAAQDLAAAFGFGFTNGFAIDTSSPNRSLFTNLNGTLVENEFTAPLLKEGPIRIYSFTGQAFTIPDEATPILRFDADHINLLPDVAWEFDESTEAHSAEGMYQLAVKQHGKGRVAMGGEAAMFTAQLAGPQEIAFGMNSDFAQDNQRLLLHIMGWLGE